MDKILTGSIAIDTEVQDLTRCREVRGMKDELEPFLFSFITIIIFMQLKSTTQIVSPEVNERSSFLS